MRERTRRKQGILIVTGRKEELMDSFGCWKLSGSRGWNLTHLMVCELEGQLPSFFGLSNFTNGCIVYRDRKCTPLLVLKQGQLIIDMIA